MVTCAAGRSQSLEASVVGILVLSWVKLSDFCKLACPHLLGVKTSEPMKFWGKVHKEKEECNSSYFPSGLQSSLASRRSVAKV